MGQSREDGPFVLLKGNSKLKRPLLHRVSVKKEEKTEPEEVQEPPERMPKVGLLQSSVQQARHFC